MFPRYTEAELEEMKDAEKPDPLFFWATAGCSCETPVGWSGVSSDASVRPGDSQSEEKLADQLRAELGNGNVKILTGKGGRVNPLPIPDAIKAVANTIEASTQKEDEKTDLFSQVTGLFASARDSIDAAAEKAKETLGLGESFKEASREAGREAGKGFAQGLKGEQDGPAFVMKALPVALTVGGVAAVAALLLRK